MFFISTYLTDFTPFTYAPPPFRASDQVRCLRARAVKYRTIFEGLKQNRQDVAFSLHRVSKRQKYIFSLFFTNDPYSVASYLTAVI